MISDLRMLFYFSNKPIPESRCETFSVKFTEPYQIRLMKINNKEMGDEKAFHPWTIFILSGKMFSIYNVDQSEGCSENIKKKKQR